MVKLLGAVAGAALLLAPSAYGNVGDACSADPTRLQTFYVEAEWTKKAYRRSEKASVLLTVTRPADTDPTGYGIPIDRPTSVPAQDVTVTTAVAPERWPPPFGRGITNEDGQVRLKIPLGNVPRGPQAASHYASYWTNENGCPDIEEWGFLWEDPAFKVR